MADEACRADVWLWRARLFKTRALAARAIESGAIRLARHGAVLRLDKSSRGLRPGDEIVFARAGRLTAVRVTALGNRRGPASEARRLFDDIAQPQAPLPAGIDNPACGLTNTPARRAGQTPSDEDLPR